MLSITASVLILALFVILVPVIIWLIASAVNKGACENEIAKCGADATCVDNKNANCQPYVPTAATIVAMVIVGVLILVIGLVCICRCHPRAFAVMSFTNPSTLQSVPSNMSMFSRNDSTRTGGSSSNDDEMSNLARMSPWGYDEAVMSSYAGRQLPTDINTSTPNMPTTQSDKSRIVSPRSEWSLSTPEQPPAYTVVTPDPTNMSDVSSPNLAFSPSQLQVPVGRTDDTHIFTSTNSSETVQINRDNVNTEYS